MPPVPARDAPAQRLATIWLDAWKRLKAQEEAIAGDPLRFRQRARLAELEREVGRNLALLDSRTRAWVGTQLPGIWAAGAQRMAATIDQGGTFGWTLLHRQGVQQVAAATYDYLLNATRYINASTKALVASIVRDETLAKLTGGTTAVQEGRVIMGRLITETGFTRVAYANGALHPVREYGQMVARTTSALAYNFGSMQQAITEGVEMMECFDGNGCGLESHEDPQQANGLVLPIQEAIAFPLAHPNCQRSWGPRPDVKPKGGADPQKQLDEAIAAGNASTSMEGRTFAKQAAVGRHATKLAQRAAKVRTP